MIKFSRFLLLALLLASGPVLSEPDMAKCVEQYYRQHCGAWKAPDKSEIIPAGTYWVCDRQVDILPENPGICIDYYGLICPIGEEWTGVILPGPNAECKDKCGMKAGETAGTYRISPDQYPGFDLAFCKGGCLVVHKTSEGPYQETPESDPFYLLTMLYTGDKCVENTPDVPPGPPDDPPTPPGPDGPGNPEDGGGDGGGDGPGNGPGSGPGPGDGPGDGGDGPGDGGDGPGDGSDGEECEGDDCPPEDGDGDGDDDDDGDDDGPGSGPGDGPGSGGEDVIGGEDPSGEEEGDERTASGSCSQGFQCGGDAIDCAVARHTWALKCAQEARKATDSDECSGDFSCEGDPIDCAVLRRQRTAYCALQPDEDVIADGKKVLDGEYEGKDREGSLENPLVIDMDAIQVSGGGGGSCPGAISAFGISIDMSPACEWMDILGRIVLAFAWLVALRILSGAVGG